MIPDECFGSTAGVLRRLHRLPGRAVCRIRLPGQQGAYLPRLLAYSGMALYAGVKNIFRGRTIQSNLISGISLPPSLSPDEFKPSKTSIFLRLLRLSSGIGRKDKGGKVFLVFFFYLFFSSNS